MLKLATILDNPGEPLAQSRYRDPRQLRELGYNGQVLFETVGLSGIASADVIADPEMRKWVTAELEAVGRRIAAARQAGLDVYILYDVLTLARDVAVRHAQTLSCKGKPTLLCPASEDALDRSAAALESLLAQLPGATGVVLRFGDNDAARLPHLVGNDIYLPHCARCSHLGRADRIANVLHRFHRLVVGKLEKRLIARAWNVRPDGMHDSVDLCRRLVERLPGDADDDRFVLSFKFTQTDFWRYQRWNESSLQFGKRPILYELECQREFEGKGGIPNWQPPLWRNGPPEVQARPPEPQAPPPEVQAPPPEPQAQPPEPQAQTFHGPGFDPQPHPATPSGLAHVVDRIRFAGLWAWVRGGGWGGPFVKDETWIDANAYAVPLLADDPKIDTSILGKRWIEQRLGVTDPAVADALMRILEHSPSVVLGGFYIGAYAASRARPWHPNADWIQDDLIDARAAWRIIGQLPDAALDSVVREKVEAAESLARDRVTLRQLLTDDNRKQLEPLMHTLTYSESLLETLRDLMAGLVAYRRCLKTRDAAHADAARKHLLAAQSHWQDHTQRHGSLPGAATAFRENHFWDLTQQILATLSTPAPVAPSASGG